MTERISERGAMSSDLSNWIIAAATVGNFVVYFLLWHQTKALFLESRQPALSVAITTCSYDSQSETFSATLLAHPNETGYSPPIRAPFSATDRRMSRTEDAKSKPTAAETEKTSKYASDDA